MPLLLTPSNVESSWLAPEEPDDPLAGVEFPRERAGWKRDRYAIRFAMQRAINERCWAGGDHSRRFAYLNMARFEIRRHFLIDHKRQHDAVRAETIAGLRRSVMGARRFSKPQLP